MWHQRFCRKSVSDVTIEFNCKFLVNKCVQSTFVIPHNYLLLPIDNHELVLVGSD